MKLHPLRAIASVLVCWILAPSSFGGDFRTGLWVLELRRFDAPVDVRKIIIDRIDDGFVVSSATDNQLENPVAQFDVDQDNIFLKILDVDLNCRLSPDREQASTWVGICPASELPDSGDTLKVVIRPPIGMANHIEKELVDSAEAEETVMPTASRETGGPVADEMVPNSLPCQTSA